MSKKQINHFQLSRSWFDFTYEHPELITANHTAMYFFILDHWNRLGWKENFGLPTCMTMEAIGIKSFNTYKKVFKDLVEWEFILLIKKSQNQYSTNVIAVSKIDRSDNKSLDRSLSNHSTNHCSITDNIIVDIDKPNNLKTLKPKNKKEFSEEKKEVFDLDEIPESPADIGPENFRNGTAQALFRQRYGRHTGDAVYTVLENLAGWPDWMSERKILAFDQWIQNLHDTGKSLTYRQFDNELRKFRSWTDQQAEENCGHSLCYPQIYEKQKQPVNGQSGHQISDGFKARYGLQ